MASSQKELKRQMNELYAAGFKRRSKQRRKAERTRRVEERERQWLAAYNRLTRRSGGEGIEVAAPQPRATSRRRRRRRA